MCDKCDPPGPWVHLVPYQPGDAVGRGFWFLARAVVAWRERAVDTVRGWRKP